MNVKVKLMPSNRTSCKRVKYYCILLMFCQPTVLSCNAFNLHRKQPHCVLFLYRWQGPECHSMQAWQFAEGNRREREGESGELECISGLKQVVHCCNSYQGRRVFKGMGVGGVRRRAEGGERLLRQTVARKHLWHLISYSLKCQT